MSSTITEESSLQTKKQVVQLPAATVRLCGDSGDGMQLAGTQLSTTSALLGNDIATFPDFPAEIRAPRGTLAGVSGFQVHFASSDIFTPGDKLNALIAMNPAALKENLRDLESRGVLIVDKDEFQKKNLEMAGYETNPLDDGSLSSYKLYSIRITDLTRKAVEGLGLTQKHADRCRNFFAMGLVYWLFGRDLEPTLRYIDDKFGSKPEIAEANRRALKHGWFYGETTEAFLTSYTVAPAKLPAGQYRSITGNEAMAYGLMAAAKLSGKELFLGSYPITPASDILHTLSNYKNFGVRTFQAEDEISAMCSVVGAAFGGAMAITTSSGPGVALKAEAMGLGVMLELPMLIINIQRGGPSTGLPTKTEQADLLQAMYGRNGECPLPVIAARSPGDCFYAAIEAWRISSRYMVPVVLLSDGYIANGAEPWLIPKMEDLKAIPISHPGPAVNGETFLPYQRDEKLSRPWALPGTPGLMHRVGGLEKQDITGNVCYEPENHEHMVRLRAQKVENVAQDLPPQEVVGPTSGDILLVSWGGTYGACLSAVQQLQAEKLSVAHCHLRHLNPLPRDFGDILRRYKKVLVAELNLGQLRMILRSRYLIDAAGLNKVKGKPFAVSEISDAIRSHLRS